MSGSLGQGPPEGLRAVGEHRSEPAQHDPPGLRGRSGRRAALPGPPRASARPSLEPAARCGVRATPRSGFRPRRDGGTVHPFAVERIRRPIAVGGRGAAPRHRRGRRIGWPRSSRGMRGGPRDVRDIPPAQSRHVAGGAVVVAGPVASAEPPEVAECNSDRRGIQDRDLGKSVSRASVRG